MNAAADFELTSFFTPDPSGGFGAYELVLTNVSAQTISGFTLGFSGPAGIGRGAVLEGGTIVEQVASWVELAPPRGFELAPGASWRVKAPRLEETTIRHWTDGATTAAVILADRSISHCLTHPTALAKDSPKLRKGVMPLPVPVPAPTPYAATPWPNGMAATGRRSAPDGFAISADADAGIEATVTFTELTENLFPGEMLVRPASEGGFAVTLETDIHLGAEAYAISFAEQSAKVRAASATGFLYGLITLAQLARGARWHKLSFSFPSGGTIEDAPAHSWRGAHLDVARAFYSSAEVKQFLRIMAWNKLNRFHWHLTEDEAWRVEIDAYPELTRRGAFRGYGMSIPPLFGSSIDPSGGYYTKDTVREIVALGADLGIDVFPEIDVPGHSYALLLTIPQLRDPGENGLYHSVQSYPNNCINPGVKTVYPVLETILGELCELFPSRYFHLGADEVPEDAWMSSPQAQALLAEIGGKDAHDLQAYFLKQLQAFLNSKGKLTGAWEEAAWGGGIDRTDCYLVGWRAVEVNQKLAAEGYDVVVAPAQAYYLDMANGPEFEEPGAGWAGWSSPENTYAFQPDAGWSDAERTHLKGVQACIWSEPMTDHAVFDRLVFPRLSAIAETAWTQNGLKSWARFSAIAGLMPSLYGSVERLEEPCPTS